jgi:hypothetical protein
MTEQRRISPVALGLAAALATIAAIAVIATAWVDDEGAAAPTRSEGIVTAGEVARSPASFAGRNVIVAGEVSDVLGPRAVAIGGDGFLPDDRLLVVARNPVGAPGGREAARPLLEGDLVLVDGTADVLEPADLQRELGVELSDRLDRLAGDPVVVADEVVIAPRLRELAGRRSVAAIAENPQRYLGRIVGVEGTVTRTLPGGAVMLDDAVLVLRPGAAEAPSVGERLSVRGAVRRFDLDALRREGIGDFDDRLFGDLADTPVIVAPRPR